MKYTDTKYPQMWSGISLEYYVVISNANFPIFNTIDLLILVSEHNTKTPSPLNEIFVGADSVQGSIRIKAMYTHREWVAPYL